MKLRIGTGADQRPKFVSKLVRQQIIINLLKEFPFFYDAKNQKTYNLCIYSGPSFEFNEESQSGPLPFESLENYSVVRIGEESPL